MASVIANFEHLHQLLSFERLDEMGCVVFFFSIAFDFG